MTHQGYSEPDSDQSITQSIEDKIEVLPLGRCTISKWHLPTSKSHLIRMVLIASQTNSEVKFVRIINPGEDAFSMATCLQQFGVEITFTDDYWKVVGVGSRGFTMPKDPLNCGNSGTSFQLLAGLCAGFTFPVTLDGDNNLRNRKNDGLWAPLKDAGVVISYQNGGDSLPMTIQGPWEPQNVYINVSNSSQPLSSLRFAAISAPRPFKVILEGNPVSRKHFELSDSISRLSGSTNLISIDSDNFELKPWQPKLPSIVEIPSDASMASFAMLFVKTHGTEIWLENWPQENDCIGNEILAHISSQLGLKWVNENNNIKISESSESAEVITVDLRDSNDLITPLAAIMAQGSGGRIIGASHARLKESNRITKTVELLSIFGIEVIAKDDGLEIIGGQKPIKPKTMVSTFGDHRMQMTATVLGSKTGAVIQGSKLHEVSFPNFLQILQSAGVKFAQNR